MRKVVRTIILISFLLLLIIGIQISKGYELPNYRGNNYCEKDWELKNYGTSYEERIKLPVVLEYKEDNNYSLSTILTYAPKDNESPYAFLSMNHMYFKVFLDNKEIYSYTKDDTPNLSKSPGNAYTMIPLPNDCQGKEFRIDFWMTLEDGLVYELGDVFFGDYATVLHSTFEEDFPHDIIIVCILFLGIILITISYVVLDKKVSQDAWNIGMFALVFGVYSITENLFNLYMISNPYITYLINFIVFACIPIPILLFFKDKVDPAFNKSYLTVFSLLIFNILMQTCLHFLKIKDIRQLLIYTHLLYVMTFLLIAISVYKTPKTYILDKKYLIYSVFPIIIGIAIEAIMHYVFITVEGRNTSYMQLGVLSFLVIEAIYVLKNILDMYKENIKGEFYKELAYKDGLTGLYNRTAFNKDVESINLKKENHDKLICICADINNLKKINDTYGHQAGDEIICLAAKYLNKYFGQFGNVYRIGGDEFDAFLYSIEVYELNRLIVNMYNEIEKYNETAKIKLQFALGYEQFYSINEENIEKCLMRADKRMYDEKLKAKSFSNNILNKHFNKCKKVEQNE